MYNEIDHDRRRLVGAAAMTFVASQFAFGGAAEAQHPRQGRRTSVRSSRGRTHHSRR